MKILCKINISIITFFVYSVLSLLHLPGITGRHNPLYKNHALSFASAFPLLGNDLNDIDSNSVYLDYFSGIAVYTKFIPSFEYYTDDQKMRVYFGGIKYEIGLSKYISVGASFNRLLMNGIHYAKNNYIASNYYTGSNYAYDQPVNNSITSLKLHLSLSPIKNINTSFSAGNLTYEGIASRRVYSGMLQYKKSEKLLIELQYENNDAVNILYAARLLYDPAIIRAKYDADLFRIAGYYNISSLVLLTGHFTYMHISDENEGNDVDFKFGKKFSDLFRAGYEYEMTNFSIPSALYYAPQHFEAHCIWVDLEYAYDNDMNLTVGGKIGYVPHSDQFVREINADLLYKFNKDISLNLNGAYGITSRTIKQYQYFYSNASILFTIL